MTTVRTRPKNFAIQTAPAPSSEALQHFNDRLRFEADCWDVHATEELEDRGFVLVDVRSREAFAKGHLPGAVHIPYAALTAQGLAEFDMSTLFVVYCAGPHCNASTRAALRLAELGRPVKEMIGGTMGWIDEGFTLEVSDQCAALAGLAETRR